MKKTNNIKKFGEFNENLNLSNKKFEVKIEGNDGKVIFFDIIDAANLNDAFDKSTDIVGIENITSHDEVDINIREIK